MQNTFSPRSIKCPNSIFLFTSNSYCMVFDKQNVISARNEGCHVGLKMKKQDNINVNKLLYVWNSALTKKEVSTKAIKCMYLFSGTRSILWSCCEKPCFEKYYCWQKLRLQKQKRKSITLFAATTLNKQTCIK